MQTKRMIDDPHVDGLTTLILDRLHPALDHAMDYDEPEVAS